MRTKRLARAEYAESNIENEKNEKDEEEKNKQNILNYKWQSKFLIDRMEARKLALFLQIDNNLTFR